MPVSIIDANGYLQATTKQCAVTGLHAVEIGKPLAIQLLSFFPGKIKEDWGGKAELMITSQTRLGPSREPAPKLVNMMLRGYDYKLARPVTEYGGDVIGERMLFYTKAYAGQEVGITLCGVELDSVGRRGQKTWEGITSTISSIGTLALFAPAAPYLAAAAIGGRMLQTLVRAFARNDRLTIQRANLFFGQANKRILQSGRYVFWCDQSNQIAAVPTKGGWRLTGTGDQQPNVLVNRGNGSRFTAVPYLVVQIDGKERSEYNNFEIEARSAELLEEFGNKKLRSQIFDSIQTLAGQVNDALKLPDVKGLIDDLEKAGADQDKASIKETIEAQTELFSDQNREFLKKLIQDSVSKLEQSEATAVDRT